MKQISELKRSHLPIFLIAILLSALFMKTSIAPSSSLPEISVINPQNPLNPSARAGNFTFYTNTTSIGDKFNATVWVYNVTDLSAYEVKLIYDPTPLVINATRAWVPDWDEQWVFFGKKAFSPHPVYDIISKDEYRVLIGSTLLYPEKAVNGTGMLAIIEFEIFSAPAQLDKVSNTLDIDESKLLDSDGNEIASVRTNGYYEYIWLEPGLEVKPSQYVAVIINQPFNITVLLNDVTSSDKLVSLQFKLRFNTTLLEVQNVSEGSFMRQFGSTTFTYQKAADYVQVNVTLTPAAGYPEGNGPLATITFKGTYQDNAEHSSNLDFVDVQLLDTDGNPMETSPSKNATYTVRPAGSSLITIDLSSTSIVINSNVTISGAIISNETKVRVDVTIYYKPSGETWSLLQTVQTYPDGNYNYTWTPAQVDTFELKANCTGDMGTYPAESEVKTLTVTKIPSALSINVNPTVVTVGENVNISGSLNPTLSEANITISYRVIRGTWDTLATVKTADGQYIYVWKVEKAGAYELRAFWPGDNITLSALSPTFPLTATKIPSTITIHVEPSVAALGTNVTISGAITPSKADANVIIYYIENESGIQLSLNAKTNSTGHYKYVWQPPKNGTFKLYAWWKGDENTHYSASSLETLIVLVPSEITLNVDRHHVTLGSTITINGTIKPPKTGANVTIYYRLQISSEQWTQLAIAQTHSNGNYTFTWAPLQAGIFELKAEWPGDNIYAPATSDPVTVKVEEQFTLLTYLPYVLAGVAAATMILAIYFLKIRKH